MIGYTYKLTLNKSPAFYIGTTTDPKMRLISHRSELKRGIHGSHMFQKAWDESGSTEVYMEILFSGEQSIAQEKEIELLRSNCSDYNLKNTCISSAKGIDYDRVDNPDLVRQRKSQAVSGEKNPMYGKNHTSETRDRISKMKLGIPSPRKGVPMSEEGRKNIAEAIRLNPPAGEKNPFYGKHHSEETKEKLRSTRIGKLPANSNTIVIGGISYPSQNQAAKALGVSPGLITHRLKNSDKYPDYKIIPPTDK